MPLSSTCGRVILTYSTSIGMFQFKVPSLEYLTAAFRYDWETSIEELMNSLHNLVVAGKVLHLVSCLFSQNLS